MPLAASSDVTGTRDVASYFDAWRTCNIFSSCFLCNFINLPAKRGVILASIMLHHCQDYHHWLIAGS